MEVANRRKPIRVSNSYIKRLIRFVNIRVSIMTIQKIYVIDAFCQSLDCKINEDTILVHNELIDLK